MAAYVRVGETVPTGLQLADGAPNKYVRAWVYGSDGSLLQGPVSLSHIAAGLYLTQSVTMPDEPFLAVQYRVYDDEDFSVLSIDHGDSLDMVMRAQDVDLSAIATTAQLTEAKEELLSTLAHKHNQVKVAVSGLSATDELEFQVWLNTDGAPVADAVSSSLSVFGADGVVVFTLGPSTQKSEQGVFRLVKTSASSAVVSGRAYTVYATVTLDSATYASITSITVF